MLVLDKSVQQNEIIVTVSESEDIVSDSYRIELHSSFTGKTYSIQLGTNQSSYKERYDLFFIDRSLFQDMEDGTYTYRIFSGAPDGRLLETGYLKIESTDNETVYLQMEEPEEDDDFIVYNQ